MKNKRLWLSVTLTVLVVVCAMLILSRMNETRSNAAPAAPTDLILPPDIQTTAQPDTKKYDDLPDVDISSWEYLIASQAHNISDYVPDVSKISGSQSTFDSRAVDALNALRDEKGDAALVCDLIENELLEALHRAALSQPLPAGAARLAQALSPAPAASARSTPLWPPSC